MLKDFESNIENSQITRKFSKEHAQSFRDETAHKIREARNRYRDNDLTHEEIINSNNQELISSYNKLKENLFGRIFKSNKYSAEKAMLDIAISNFTNEKTTSCINEIKRNFNQKIIELMQNTSLTKEEQEEYLSLENISKMSLEDYLSLMNRLSGFYFSHITRFGLKEEVGIHGGGMNSVIDSFTAILKSRKLGGLVDNILSEETYAKWFFKSFIEEKNLNDSSKEDVINLFLKNFYDKEFFNGCPSPDASSTHFSYSMVSSGYGGESGYNIYFYFPVEVIGKNFQHDLDPSISVSDKSQNDQVVWNAENGIPIDAGIVCIPENVPVDRQSGSKYVMNERREPILRNECGEHVESLQLVKDEFDRVMKDLSSEYLDLRFKKDSSKIDLDEFFNRADVLEYAKKFGFMDIEEKTIANLENYYYEASDWASYYRDTFRDEHLKELDKKMFLFIKFISEKLYFFQQNDALSLLKDFYSNTHLYHRSEGDVFFRLFLEKPSKDNTISSMEYWDNYFKENPNIKPSKIIYYNNKNLFSGVKTNNYLSRSLSGDDVGKNYVDLVSESKFKDNIVGMDDFFIKSGFNDVPASTLEKRNIYPRGYLEFWKEAEPKIRDVLGKMYLEIKAQQNSIDDKD